MKPEHETLDLLLRHAGEETSTEETAELSRRLRGSAEARESLRELALQAIAVAELAVVGKSELAASKVVAFPRRRIFWAAGIAAALVLAGLSWFSLAPHPHGRDAVARFGTLENCRWVDAQMRVEMGDSIHRGQRVELSAGRAEMIFACGAVATLIGPCIFEVESAKSGFLTLGQMKTRAETPASKGFTIRTRTARVVDVGTEFVTSAAADGQSRVDVTSGEVFVHLDGVKMPQRLRKGDALSVEAGKGQVMVRIESGDETAAFRLPSIEPPSRSDAADVSQGRASVRVVKGKLAVTKTVRSAPQEVLLDGHAQKLPDSPEESVYFANNEDGMLLMDLGRAISIARINSYSWHQNGTYPNQRVRAAQKFTLYGYAGDEPPLTDGRLTDAGWTLIARVNSDEFFRVAEPIDRPAQQACSISAARGAVGRYRYLLWELQAAQGPNTRDTNPTFYGEIDVYEQR